VGHVVGDEINETVWHVWGRRDMNTGFCLVEGGEIRRKEATRKT